LTRFALAAQQIDAATFTAIRLGSGAVVLALLVRSRSRSWTPLRATGAHGPLALFAYAAPFSFAYLRIGASVGALVLFGIVQLTMIGYGITRGDRPSPLAWTGVVLAVAGLGCLTIPSLERPDPVGVMLMAIAGVAWGIYSIAGRKGGEPIAANARAFLWSTPLALVLALFAPSAMPVTVRGIALAIVSGAITSGLGYAIWYRALPQLSVMQAAVAQLAVPVIAALAAVGLLHEPLTVRLAASGAAVLIGVVLVLVAKIRLGV
jgi:drug/metabolite transporter (DMT)-like permease